MTKEVLALSAVRSAVGAFGGSTAGFSPGDLGGLVAKEAFARAGVDPKQATYAVVGNVVPCAFSFPYVPRRLTIQAGMAMESTVMACNRLCGSAMPAIVRLAQKLRPGDAGNGLGAGAEVIVGIVQRVWRQDPFSGTSYVFRCQRGDRVKLLVWDGSGLVLIWKRLEASAFKWPPISDGVMRLSAAQLAALLEGLDWTRVHVPRLGRPKAAQ